MTTRKELNCSESKSSTIIKRAWSPLSTRTQKARDRVLSLAERTDILRSLPITTGHLETVERWFRTCTSSGGEPDNEPIEESLPSSNPSKIPLEPESKIRLSDDVKLSISTKTESPIYNTSDYISNKAAEESSGTSRWVVNYQLRKYEGSRQTITNQCSRTLTSKDGDAKAWLERGIALRTRF